MADLLTHVLAAYVIATVLSWRLAWVTPAMVAAAMAGAVSPDLNRLELLLPAAVITGVTGLAWDWSAMHRLGGMVLVMALVAVVVHRSVRWTAVLMVAIGATSHHLLDLVLINVSGRSYAVLWPLTEYHLPSPNLYLSSDRWPGALAVIVGGIVWGVDRHLDETAD